MTISYRSFFILSAVCFVFTAGMDEVAALRLIAPVDVFSSFGFEKLRPLHTTLAIAAVLSGIFGLTHFILHSNDGNRPAKVQTFQFAW